MRKLNRFLNNCPWREERVTIKSVNEKSCRSFWVIQNILNVWLQSVDWYLWKATVLIDLYILSCYSVNLLIYWICYHSNCFHSSRSKKWSNILHNGLSFVEEISRWLKLHGVKNDVKLLRIEINLLRWTIFSRIHRNVCICCENEIFFSFLLEWFKYYCRRKENKIKRILAVCCKFNARIV